MTLYEPMDCRMPGFPVLHYLWKFTQTHVHWVGDAIQSYHPLSPPSPPVSVFPSIRVFSRIFLLAILILAYSLSKPAFCMMYSANKLNKQGDDVQTWSTPFPIWKHSAVPCPVLAIASWSAYRFLRRQVRWSGIPNSFKNFPQFVVTHTVKSFGVINEA